MKWSGGTGLGSSPAVDLLKLIGIAGIMARHLHWYFDLGVNKIVATAIVTGGELGVNIFLFCSGWGLTVSACRGWPGGAAYARKRILRVYPLYLVALLFYVFWVARLDGRNFLLHALGLHSFVLPLSHWPEPFWFMGVLFQLYLLFPLGFRLLAHSRALFWGMVVMLASGNYLVVASINAGLPFAQRLESAVEDSSIFSFLPIVALGMQCGYAKVYGQVRWMRNLHSLLGMGIVLLCLYLFMKYRQQEFDYRELYLLGKKVFVVFASFFVLSFSRWYHQEYFRHSFAVLSSGCFCAYLFHEFIFAGVACCLGSNGPVIVTAMILPLLMGVMIQEGYERMVRAL